MFILFPEFYCFYVGWMKYAFDEWIYFTAQNITFAYDRFGTEFLLQVTISKVSYPKFNEILDNGPLNVYFDRE